MSDNKTGFGPTAKLLQLGGAVGQERKDGWRNLLTGLGIGNKDKLMGGSIDWRPITESFVESLYAGDDVSRKIVDEVPEEGTREWIELKISDTDDAKQEQLNLIKDEMERLKVKQKFAWAWKLARLYGGAGVFIGADDSQDPSEELNIDNIRQISSLTVFDRFELDPIAINSDIMSEDFLKPAMYRLVPRVVPVTTAGAQGFDHNLQIHGSRIIRFIGMPLTRRLSQTVRWWGDSVLNASFNAIRNYNLSHDSLASVAQDFRVGILKIKGLADIVTSDNLDAFKNRLEALRLAKSVMSVVAIDADDEDFTNLTTNLRGLKEVLEKIGDRLVVASKLPHTVILGEGAAGSLSGKGESEERMFKDHVANQQEINLEEPIDIVVELIQAQKLGPTKGKMIEGLTWAFLPLIQQTTKEKAETNLIQAEADQKNIESGMVSPDEAALSRFGGDEFTTETTIQTEFREERLENGELEEEDIPEDEVVEDNFVDHNHEYELDDGSKLQTGGQIGDGPEHTHGIQSGDFTGPRVEPLEAGESHTHMMPDGLTPTGISKALEAEPEEFEGESSREREFFSDSDHPVRRRSRSRRGRVPRRRKKKKKDEIVHHLDVIVKKGSQFCVMSQAGKNLGCFDTEPEAEKRLRQVEFFKRKDLATPAQFHYRYKDDLYEFDTDEAGFDPGLLQSIVLDKKSFPTRNEAELIARRFGFKGTSEDIDEVEMQWIFNVIEFDKVLEGSVRTFSPPIVGVVLKFGQLRNEDT